MALNHSRSAWGAGRDARTGPLIVAMACLLGAGLTGVVFIWTRSGQVVDRALLSEIGRDGALVRSAKVLLSFVGDPLVLAGSLIGAFLVGVLCGRIAAALAGTAVLVCSVAGTRLLKLLLIRPDFDVVGSTTHNSFPSGHVAVVTALVFTVLSVLPTRVRWWCAVPGALVVAAVGVATVIVSWHRPSDVVGAVLLTAAPACVAVWAARQRPV